MKSVVLMVWRLSSVVEDGARSLEDLPVGMARRAQSR